MITYEALFDGVLRQLEERGALHRAFLCWIRYGPGVGIVIDQPFVSQTPRKVDSRDAPRESLGASLQTPWGLDGHLALL